MDHRDAVAPRDSIHSSGGMPIGTMSSGMMPGEATIGYDMGEMPSGEMQTDSAMPSVTIDGMTRAESGLDRRNLLTPATLL